MFNDIRGDLRVRTYVSYILAICMIGITSITILIPELKTLYSADDGSINILIRFTIPFQHGFDSISAVIHLVINLLLLWFIGTFLEKIIGSFRFLMITLASYFFYILAHRLLILIGHGFTPIILSYSGVLFMVMAEGRFVKTRSSSEEYFRTLVGIQVMVWVLFPFVVSFIPLYFDSQMSVLQNVFYGNITHLIGGVVGILAGFVIRGHIREKLIQHTRKRYLRHGKLDKLAVSFALIFPLYLIFVFFYNPA